MTHWMFKLHNHKDIRCGKVRIFWFQSKVHLNPPNTQQKSYWQNFKALDVDVDPLTSEIKIWSYKWHYIQADKSPIVQ